jgi:2-aminoadipate transaminase
LGQATVYEFIRRGNFDSNLARVRDLLRARRDAMLEALEAELGGTGAGWSRPQGGYFVWLDVPGADAGELLGRSTAAGVTFVPGTDFGGAASAARLAYSFVSPDEIREGIPRLVALLPSAATL